MWHQLGHGYGHFYVDDESFQLGINHFQMPDLWTFMGPFNETITWIRFKTELRQSPPSFWMLLGECMALVQTLRGAPLPPAESRSLDQELTAYGLLARVALDGSTLRAEQLLMHVEGLSKIPPTHAQEIGDVDHFRDALDSLQLEFSTSVPSLTPERILGYRSVLGVTPNGPPTNAWRNGPMGPGELQGVPFEMIPLFMVELCDWLASPELAPPAPEEAPHYALLRSMVAELYLAWIQPFGSAGYRVAGLVGQHLLATGGLAGAWTHLTAVHYHRARPEFLRQIGQAAQGMGDPIPFLAYSLRGLLDGLKELVGAIRNAQTHGQWRAHVENLLLGEKGPIMDRHRALLLGLYEEQEPTAIGMISQLDPELARLYAGVSNKTLQRDVDALVDRGALQRTAEGVRARREIVRGFRG